MNAPWHPTQCIRPERNRDVPSTQETKRANGPAAKEAAKMKLEKLEQDTIDLLFQLVVWHMSNVVIFNLAYFCVGLDSDADHQFREALNQELFRRGFLKTPDFTIDNVDVDRFTADEMDSIERWFACDPDEPTAEDSYVRLLTGRNRWAEPNTPKRKLRAARPAQSVDAVYSRIRDVRRVREGRI
jgi:hypothetical protein